MKKVYYILFAVMVLCVACQFKLKPNIADEDAQEIKVQRYDRLESRYLTTGDFAALQQMNTDYPQETRILIEKMLQLGDIKNPKISNQFLRFFQDSTLQELMSDAESQYADMDDINHQLKESFGQLSQWIPNFQIPQFYAQIGALDQSIVIGENSVGISLDKYMGTDYPLYKKYYSEDQLKSMTRQYIVPDCICFYLLSIYRMNDFETRPQLDRDLHFGKLMWVANKAMNKPIFKTPFVTQIDKYMKNNKSISIRQLLENDDYSVFKN